MQPNTKFKKKNMKLFLNHIPTCPYTNSNIHNKSHHS